MRNRGVDAVPLAAGCPGVSGVCRRVAEALRAAVSRMEAGRYDPWVGVVQRLGKAPGVSLMELLG